MSTEAKGDGKRDAVGGGEQEAPASVSSRAAEIPVTDDEAGPAGEVATASEDDEAAGRQDAAGDEGAAGRDEDEPDDGAGEDDEDDDYYFDGDEEVADDDETDGSHPPAEPIDFAEPVELDEPAAALRPRRRWTRVLVAVGFVIIAAAIVGGAIAIVGSVTHGFKKPVKVTYKKSAVFSLKTGDCFDPSGQSYTLVSCDSPHQAEVYATFALSGPKWPGSTAAAAAASGGCATRLSGYLNPQLAVSLASTYVYPDATAWQAGTRTVICEVHAASGDLTGSVRGAAASAG
ncbi:MAG TPA: septum formation family protein [Trebonia sp.]|jgi:hypothetical protein|nr:septum formation family protein [Trebonia sp.]